MNERARAGLLVLVGLAGCAARSRPQELVALEKLRADPALSDSDRRAFDLLAAADDLMVRAEGEWEGRDAYRARRDALMGQIQMKTALAILQTEHLQARLADTDAALSVAGDEEARLEEQLAIAGEELALLEQLRTTKRSAAEERKSLSAQMETTRKQAAAERQRLADQLAAEKRRAEALDGIRGAELALRTAETVDTPRYAKPKYTAAMGMLKDAHKAFDAGQWDEALARTALCRSETEAGISVARPLYEKAAESLSARARDRALEAAATALPGIRTRLERDNDLQRLVLVPGDLFADGRSVLPSQAGKVLDALEGLMVAYPTYTVQITGFSDDRDKSADLPVDLGALSLARANAVYWALVGRGVDARRLSVDPGAGSAVVPAAAPVAIEHPAPPSHDRNGRVELAILYHIGE